MHEASTTLGHFFSELPLWGMLLMTLGILSVAFEGGFLLGRRRRKRRDRSDPEKNSLIDSMAAATLGLLALMLAFTFGMAGSHFKTRRELVISEANAIRSAYAMTELLGESPCSESRRLLREYVDIRLRGIQSMDELKVVISRANEIQDQLWSIAMAGEAENTGTSASWVYVQSLSDMIDVQAKRISHGAHTKIPTSIWVVLHWLAVLGMAAMGYRAGLVGMHGFFAYLTLILTFSLVIVLIHDLDRPKQSLFKVNQQALVELRQRMAEPVSALPSQMR